VKKSRKNAGEGGEGVDYGISDRERRRLARLLGRSVAEIDWVTVGELSEALEVPPETARGIVRGYAVAGSPVEKFFPWQLAQDAAVNVRTLGDWESAGLSDAAIGFRNTKRYIYPCALEWVDRYRGLQFYPGRVGIARRRLDMLDVIRDELAAPPDASSVAGDLNL
jgi:hypothetical protein